MPSTKIIKGNLLIAEPSSVYDQPFNRSIVLLTEYNEEGTVGFIINKPLDYSINDLIPTITAEFSVFYGGPVSPENVYFIHNVPNIITDGIEISPGLFWGGNFENKKVTLPLKIGISVRRIYCRTIVTLPLLCVILNIYLYT
jgi:putative transcriptional regulator